MTTSAQPNDESLPKGSPLPYKLAGLDGSLTLLQVIGSGSYGKVFMAKTNDGRLRAAKCIPLRLGPSTLEHPELSPETEAQLLKLVKHDNVIRLYDSKVVDGRLWLSMEFAAHGNLVNYLQNDSRKYLEEHELAVVAQSVLKALKYVHKRKVIHRDIKPTNLLLTRDGRVKVGDMGTACMAVCNRSSVQGTFQYLAPEIFSVQSYDAKVDIWALGMTLLELAQGFNPFQSEHFARVLFHLVEAPTAPALEDSTGHSCAFVDFLSKCLTLNPSLRPSAADLLKHPFLKKAAKVLCGASAPSNTAKSGRNGGKSGVATPTNFGSLEVYSSMSSAASTDSFHSLSDEDSESRPSLDIECLNKAAREASTTSNSNQSPSRARRASSASPMTLQIRA